MSSRYSRADFLDLLRTSPGLSDAAVRLALVLDGYARATGRCWPSQRRLARDLGWSLRKAERTMAELLSAGLVVYLERARHRGEQSEIELRTTVTDGTAAKSDGGSSGGTTVTDGGGGGGEPPSPVTRTTVTDGGQKQYMKQEEPTSDVETPDPEVSDEVRLLTRHLATRIRDNGFKLPGEGTKARRSWLLEMDRLLRLDEADPAEVPQIIDWSTADDFWRANIRSAPKFRKQYPTLRLRWLSSNGHGGGDRASLIGTGGVPS